MAVDDPLAEYEFGSGPHGGARLTLYANRLVYQGPDAMEAVPLAHLAAVGVAFERDSRKFNWATGMLIAAIALWIASGPLQTLIAGAAARMGDSLRRDSLDALLHGVFNALGGVASTLPGFAAALAAGAAALLAFYWLGVTVFTLSFAATERSYAVRGRNRLLVEFAGTVADQFSAHRK